MLLDYVGFMRGFMLVINDIALNYVGLCEIWKLLCDAERCITSKNIERGTIVLSEYLDNSRVVKHLFILSGKSRKI